MRVPARRLSFGPGLELDTREVPSDVWQAHVAKHPLGVRAMAFGKRLDAWDAEGWTKLIPPAFEAARRDALVGRIGALSLGAAGHCEVPEFRGGRGKRWSEPNRLACYDCGVGLRKACGDLDASNGVAGAYLRVTEDVLSVLAEANGICVPREQVQTVLMKNLRTPAVLHGLTLMSFGGDDSGSLRGSLARAQRWDGVRVDLYRRGARLEWRTTYRLERSDRADVSGNRVRFQGLLNMLPADSDPVSETCVVARPWWEQHGH